MIAHKYAPLHDHAHTGVDGDSTSIRKKRRGEKPKKKKGTGARVMAILRLVVFVLDEGYFIGAGPEWDKKFDRLVAECH